MLINIIWFPRTEKGFSFLFLFCEKAQGKMYDLLYLVTKTVHPRLLNYGGVGVEGSQSTDMVIES